MASQVRLISMSDGHIYLIRFGGQPQYIFFPHFLLLPAFFLSPTSSLMFFLAGDLTQWHLPVGMKNLNLGGTEVTGKATSE